MRGESLSRRVARAVAAADEDALRECAGEARLRLLRRAPVPDPVFRCLAGLLARDEFRRVPAGSWYLVDALRGAWERLSPGQRGHLLAAAEEAYPHFSDWMSCFVVSELFGETAPAGAALPALLRLAATPAEVPRSLVPHGLEHLAARDGGDTGRRALDALVAMEEDASQEVRSEVDESLSRLAGRVPLPARSWHRLALSYDLPTPPLIR